MCGEGLSQRTPDCQGPQLSSLHCHGCCTYLNCCPSICPFVHLDLVLIFDSMAFMVPQVTFAAGLDLENQLKPVTPFILDSAETPGDPNGIVCLTLLCHPNTQPRDPLWIPISFLLLNSSACSPQPPPTHRHTFAMCNSKVNIS